MTETFDVIVIGGGPVGENVADYARQRGMTVALVERELLGGECSYWACMPSKALLRPGEVLAAARRVPAAAPAVTGGVDVAKALATRDAFTSHWDDKYQAQWVESTGTSLLRGIGRLAGERTVEVEADDGSVTTLQARKAVVVATGSLAAFPPIDGLADVRVWDNRDITTAKEVPRRLLVLGGGVVGSEMAQAFKRLGADQVTIVEMLDRLIATEEPFVGGDLRQAFEAEGITVHTGARAERVTRPADDAPVTLTLADGTSLEADELLVAAGRRPRTEDIGMETVGLEPGRPITVDDQMRATGVDGGWLYAAGDVNGRVLLTHHGKYQARLLADVIAGEDVAAWADHRAVVRVVFTDPQVAAVGLTEAQAREQGHDVRVLQHKLGATAGGALVGKDIPGTAQLVVDTATRMILGATFTGPGVGEMIHAATIAIVGEVTLDRLWHAVPSFPTVSEVWLRLLEAERGA